MSGSRRVACKVCRDRKVRCDGDQPTCDRCRRAGETCVYSQTYNPTKADLLQTIETLKDRVDTLLSQQARTATAGFDHQHSNLGTAINVDYHDCSPLNLPTPSSVNHDDLLLSTDRHGYQSMVQFTDSLDNHLLKYLTSPQPTEQNDSAQFQVGDMLSSNGNNALSLHQGRAPRSHMPSLREVRELNRLPCLDDSPISLALSSSRADETVASENYRRTNIGLMNFCSAAFATQTEIAGISSAVAEYLAWVRKKTFRSPVGATPEANLALMLETLELRVRELHEMAETRHWTAWEQVMTALKKDGLDAQFSAFEGEMQEQTDQAKQFFQENYDVTVPLSEQMLHDQKKD